MKQISRRTFLKLGLAASVGLAVPAGVLAQTPPPPPGTKPTGPVLKKVTRADRLKAIQNAQTMGLKPGAAAGSLPPLFDGLGNYIPHYFGPYANYANSPMPKGSISEIVMDNVGGGYVNPKVVIDDVYGTGSGAAAQAVLNAGKVVSITVTNGGSNYTAPMVTIEETNSSDPGANAAATPVMSGPFTGGIRKFVDKLAGLNQAGANDLGNFIPVAVPDKTTYPGSDYYEIEVGDFTQKLHSDLPATKVRGYRQVNTTSPNNQFHYLGPLIIAEKDVPIRLLFINNLGTGATGNLFIPVDTSIMGVGAGPLGGNYTQNRACIHLHGGLTPWISDGTPYQWITPAGEPSQYKRGESYANVPDMWYDPGGILIPGASVTQPGGHPTATNDPGPGKMTYYFVNAQSARLMFYHDHSHGITRLNVYAGEAAGYLLTDDVEKDLINATNTTGVNLTPPVSVLPDLGIPLIFQDKTFVDADTILWQDPNWVHSHFGSNLTNPVTGDMWVPNVNMPAQNPWDPSGASAFGRWQYGPWFWPPTQDIDFPPVNNEYFGVYDWEPPKRPAMPNPSMGMESFNDTSMVNGVIYPYMELEPKTYRFRVLNAANDRFYNLHWYVADPDVVTADGRKNTEVKMVPALANPNYPPTWSTDGREGGVPDPATMGPDWIVIGTEGGFLPEPVVIPPQPINWNMNPTAFNFGVVTDHSLLLGNAERADVLVDFSQFAGKTLILYNDAPTAFPALDARYDYYTGNPNQMDSGGAPTTQAGYGPNTRTVMQVKVKSGTGGTPKALANISIVSGGTGYSAAPIVEITGGGGSGATATATCGVDKILVTNPGVGYTNPVVIIDGGGGAGATANAILSGGRIVGINVTNPGSGYTSAPNVFIFNGQNRIYIPYISNDNPGSGVGQIDSAIAVATLAVNNISLTNVGSGYTSVPTVSIFSGGGYGAVALANLPGGTPYNLDQLKNVWKKTSTKTGVFEKFQDPIIIPQAAYNSAYNANFPDVWVLQQDWEKTLFGGPLLPNNQLFSLTLKNGGSGYLTGGTGLVAVTISGGGGTGATAEAWAENGVITSVSLLTGGTGYTSAPTIAFAAPGTGAVAVANEIPIGAKAIQDEMGEAYDLGYGRMSGFLGLEQPTTAAGAQKFTLYPYATPPLELIKNTTTQLLSVADGMQIWKITHNGVDTHPIHVHLFNAQLVNRVAWDGAIVPTEPFELGWKETIRVNPLEHTIIALRPVAPSFPFDVPNSVRLIDPTQPAGVNLMGGPGGFKDPTTVAAPVTNDMVNFGWEYVWHCHILSHEEMDMMHPLSFAMAPFAPTALTANVQAGPQVLLNWTDNSATETHFAIQRRVNVAGAPWIDLSHKVVKLTVTNGGTGYNTATVSFSGGGGTGAAATATLTLGVITGLVITNPGSGYRSAPTVTITGDGNNAAATASLGMVPANTTTFTDTSVTAATNYQYRVVARNTVGYTKEYAAPSIGYPTLDADSAPSNVVDAAIP